MRYSPTWKFVDDITIYEIVSQGSASQIQQDVKEIESWSSKNKLQLHPDKCKELVIDFKQRKDQFDPIYINQQSAY